MMHFDIYGFAQDQASDQKVEIGDLDTPEGRLLRREREIVLDVEKRSDPLGTEEIIKLIHELTELARALNY